MYSNNLIKGTLRLIILRLLSLDRPMYGYELSQKVKELSDGKIALTEGALYPTLHKLEAEGLVTVSKENIGKRIRKYYTVTNSGKEYAEHHATEFVEFVQTMLILLNPGLKK